MALPMAGTADIAKLICTYHWLEQLRDSTTLARCQANIMALSGSRKLSPSCLDSSTTCACCQAGMMAFDHNRRMHKPVLGSTTYGNL